ncbi:Tyrosine-protein kinase, catalytic domain [Phytophthora cactorum]|nr:Tyrosine-protein kinase, catalytic domain [Phytophthora cactorum]
MEMYVRQFRDLSEVNETISLNLTQSTNLEANAKTLSAQGWANHYHSNCTTSPFGQLSYDCLTRWQKELTLSCNLPDLSEIESSKNGSSTGDSSSGISTGALVAIIVVVVVIAVVLAVLILRIYFKRKAANASAHNNEASATLMSKGDAAADKGSFISNDEFLRNFRLPQSDVALVKSQVQVGCGWASIMVIRVRSNGLVRDEGADGPGANICDYFPPEHHKFGGGHLARWHRFRCSDRVHGQGQLEDGAREHHVDLDITTKLQICCDVALALAYLHETEQNLCAKQLSSRKVLVNKAMNCKLSLFECVPSSAKLGGPSTAATYSYGMGEVAWLPPEIITRSSPMDARKINIYAFGVLVSEIFTRTSPYQSLVEAMGNTMSDVELVKRVRRQDPLVPHENRQEFLAAPASVRQMVEQCLSYAPMSRPTAKDLVEILHNAKEELAMNSI